MNKGLQYVQHEVGSHRHWKFKILRRKLGWKGEGQFWALNNMIAESDDCQLDVSDEDKRQELAAEIDMEIDEFDQFVDYLVKSCKLIIFKEPYFLSTKISQETLQSVVKRRKRNNESYKKMKGETEDKTPDNLIHTSDPDADQKPLEMPDMIAKGVKTLMDFYGLNEVNHFNQMTDIKVALVKINRKGLLPHFRMQFRAYREYKELSGEMVHGYVKFLNPEDPTKGAWNQTNWIKKLEKCKETKNPTEISPSFKILD
jgi:hypothetical protein